MNIVIFSWRGPGHPNAGGAEIVTHQHAKAWVKVGHKVTLFTSYFPGAKKEETIDGVAILRRGGAFAGVRFEAWRWYWSLDQKPDLVFDHFHGIPFFTPLFVGVKKVAFIHEVAKEVWCMNNIAFPFNLIYATTGYFSEPFIFRFLYRDIPFVTVSDSTRGDLIKWGIKDVVVIHNGVCLPKSDIKYQKLTVKTAIYLGALSKDKGIEDALKAFALINQREKNWQFWIVGSGERNYREILEDRCKRYGIRSNTKFWGYVSEEKKFELLAKAWIMTNPSVREGWGLVNIEANSVGTPVIAYDVPGNRDSIKDGYSGIVIKAKSPEGIAVATKNLIKDTGRYERMKEDAKKWSKKFSWERSTKQSLDLIRVIDNSNCL